jgi:diguanylate cyclase (GGDEF)-like protein
VVDFPDPGAVRPASADRRAGTSQRWQRLRRGGRQLLLSRLEYRGEAPSRRIGHDLSAEDVQSLETIAGSESARYRFSPQLEQRFLDYSRLSSRNARISIAAISFLMYAAAPLWSRILATPPETAQLMLLLELGIMTPMFGVLGFFLARKPLSAGTEWFLIAALISELLAVEIVRYISADFGFRIEPSIVIVVPITALVLARLSFNRSLAFIAAYLVAVLGLQELWPNSDAHRSPTAWVMESMLLGLSLLSVIWSRLTMRRQWAANLLLEIMAYRDALTGLANRRAFEEHYDTMIRALPHSRHGTLLFTLIDLDHFKALNDHYGHEYGDGALAEVGIALAGLARRPLDMAARIGGEELALLLFDCEVEDAAERAQAIVDAIGSLGIVHETSATGTLTCSVGAVIVHPDEALSSAYRRADECLYQVKRRGRNGYRLLG